MREWERWEKCVYMCIIKGGRRFLDISTASGGIVELSASVGTQGRHMAVLRGTMPKPRGGSWLFTEPGEGNQRPQGATLPQKGAEVRYGGARWHEGTYTPFFTLRATFSRSYTLASASSPLYRSDHTKKKNFQL